MGISKQTARVGTVASLKASSNKKATEDHILLARGLSARYCGANTPLMGLTGDEMERDLRHMEAFANASTAYCQQYYIYQNSNANIANANSNNSSNAAVTSTGGGVVHSSSSHNDNDDTNDTTTTNSNDKHRKAVHSHPQTSQQISQQQQQQQPLISMPVRIDPEEEKRLMTLRQKIQHCEAQREVLESQYLSLRAHYVYLSQRLVALRGTVNGRVTFLQGLVKARGQRVAVQRARLQICREVLACLHYRQSGGIPQEDTTTTSTTTKMTNDKDKEDLVDVWNQVDEEFKQAELACRSDGLEPWQALKVPKVPPGLPLLLSQLAKGPGFAAAWSTGGVFGSHPESLSWIDDSQVTHSAGALQAKRRSRELPALRDEVEVLQRDLGNERTLNQELQTNIIKRRQRNDELVAMMALLRTETEAVVARHNILLESELAKQAAFTLHEDGLVAEEQEKQQAKLVIAKLASPAHDHHDSPPAAAAAAAVPEQPPQEVVQHTAAAPEGGVTTTTPPPTPPPVETVAVPVEQTPQTEDVPATTTTTTINTTTTTATTTTPIPEEDVENYGDDEGQVGEEDEDEEGEILEAGAVAEKRPLEQPQQQEGEGGGDGGGSPPPYKRRRL